MAKKAKKTGRPAACSAARAGKILAAIESGQTQEAACKAANISVSTWRRWRRKSEENDKLFARAQEAALEVYEGEYRECTLLLLSFARNEDFDAETRMRAVERVARMLQFLLAANDKAKYGKSQRVELTGKDGKELEVQRDVDMEALRQVAMWKAEFEKQERDGDGGGDGAA